MKLSWHSLTRSSANAEEMREHVSWNRAKCCTNVRQIAFEKACNWQMSSIVSISLSCTVSEILTLICQKLRRHVTLITPTWGQFVITRLILFGPTRAQIWWFYLQPFQRKLRGCKILKWITWAGPRPFQGWSVIRSLTLDTACKHTKFDDVSAVPEIFQGVWNSRMHYVTLTTPT